ncbi:MAG: DUF420 domain-containing protein [Cytophagales bacterium]|nr:MAG: DUF420 domain-containing protein [Cytophagales bacterium]
MNSVNKLLNYKVINIVSYLIPIVVAILLGIRTKYYLGDWTRYLPHLNAVINFLTAVFLFLGFIAVKNRKLELHKKMMLSAFSLGSVFLVSYVIYHLSNSSTKFGGQGLVSFVYYFLLITHIILAAVVVKFVLMALFYAFRADFDSHKKVVKYTFPIWMYVSISGVVVYLMISPYYL